MRVGIAKLGAMGSSILLEYCLNEVAMREDFETFVVSSGSRIDLRIIDEIERGEFDLKIVACPDAERNLKRKITGRVVVVTDRASEDWLESVDWGYIVVKADSMIGARMEFLDPTEMVLYNSDILKVLAVTGVYRLLQFEIERALRGDYLPRVVVDFDKALEYAGFSNPYAKAKAIASYIIAEEVSKITRRACFHERDLERFTTLCAAAHEMMRVAGILADSAREVEKSNDTVLRTPHSRYGDILSKTRLYDLPR
ncbi:MAG: methylenetetrahydromethanopterin dehydrogenase [Archaeoglobales archaeon]|nr:MAG: methylenetetrahydromethanopterin dehydrogenase [Archaeoglobales archaeon]